MRCDIPHDQATLNNNVMIIPGVKFNGFHVVKYVMSLFEADTKREQITLHGTKLINVFKR